MAINISAQNHSASQPWVESLSEIRQQLHYHNRYHLQALKDVQQSIDTLTQTVNSLQTHHTSQHHTNHPSYVQFPLSKQSNPHVSWQQFLLKNDLPKFDGKDPHAWIFRSQEFFEYHNVSHEQRLSCVSFMVHGEALKWFDWMKSNELLRSWDDFLDQVKFRFDPIYFEDVAIQFPKLHQVPTMAAYQAEYEKFPPLTPNEGQQHESGHLEHPREYSNTQCENDSDVDLILEEHVTISQDYPSIEVMEVLQHKPDQESRPSRSHEHDQKSFKSFFLLMDHPPGWHELPPQIWLYFIPLYTLRSRCFLKGWRVIRIKGKK